MASEKQIEANRRNALRSTGPRTPAGKANASLNALRHGLRARSMLLPGEDAEEFRSICDEFEAEWQPANATEQFYVEQMFAAAWKLRRMEVGENSVFLESPTAKEQVPLLDRFWQAQCRLERSFARAQRELERTQSARLAVAEEPVLEPASERAPVQSESASQLEAAEIAERGEFGVPERAASS